MLQSLRLKVKEKMDSYQFIRAKDKNDLERFYPVMKELRKDLSYSDDLLNESALTSAIISFRFKIKKIEAKFKLSQNRSPADKAGVIDGLSERTDDMSRIVREMMLANE